MDEVAYRIAVMMLTWIFIRDADAILLAFIHTTLDGYLDAEEFRPEYFIVAFATLGKLKESAAGKAHFRRLLLQDAAIESRLWAVHAVAGDQLFSNLTNVALAKSGFSDETFSLVLVLGLLTRVDFNDVEALVRTYILPLTSLPGNLRTLRRVRGRAAPRHARVRTDVPCRRHRHRAHHCL